MSLDSILFFFTAGLTILAIALLYLRNKGQDTIAQYKQDSSIYTNMGGLAKNIRVLSINANPWLCVLVVVMLSLVLAFSIVDLLLIPAWSILPITLTFSSIILFSISELAQLRRRRFEKKIPETIEIMQAASMAGSTPQSALKTVSENGDGLIKSEFKMLLNALDYGSTIEGATARISALYDSESTRMLIQVLIVRWKLGGDLNELLGSVSKMVRERLSIRLRANAKLSGAKYSAIFMGLAPYLLIPFFLNSQPQWLQIFIDHPLGMQTLGAAILLQLLGIVWLRQVLKVKL